MQAISGGQGTLFIVRSKSCNSGEYQLSSRMIGWNPRVKLSKPNAVIAQSIIRPLRA
jgi:hypothetical protein